MIPAEFRAVRLHRLHRRRASTWATRLDALRRGRVRPRPDAADAGVRHRRLRRHRSSRACSPREYDIQLNKTSRNSVLLQTNINNTRSDVAHLIKVLAEIVAARSTSGSPSGGEASARRSQARVKSLIEDVPDLPNFSRFHDALPRRPEGTTHRRRHARRRSSWPTTKTSCEHLKLTSPEIDERLEERPGAGLGELRDPLPAGLPDHGAGPGDRRRTPSTFMRKLDVKEIHGYNASRA